MNVFLYLLYNIFAFIILIIPDRLRYLVGIGLGKLVFSVKSRIRVGIKNLKIAFPDLSTEEARQLTKRVCHHLGLNLVEFITLSRFNKADLSDQIEIEHRDILEKAFFSGKGVIIFSAHFGNWEWLPIILSLLGYPVNAIARAQNNPYFDRKITKIRQEKGIRIILKGRFMRRAVQALKQGELLYILGDQAARQRGWLVDFFGRSTSTYPGPVHFAAATGALILPVFLVREGWRQHRLKIYQPYSLRKGASEKEQYQLLQQLTTLSEEVIREYPEQWLWLHRRWKNSD